MQETRNEKQVAVKQEAGLPSTIDFEADKNSGFENLVEQYFLDLRFQNLS